jgi:hypothetical protein
VSFDKQYCFLPVCDGCGNDCWETEICPHYASEREARHELAAAYEWRITRRLDGRFEMLCHRCGQVRRDFPPAPGHLESVTAELSETDEEFLAALDAELFPEEAI